MSECHMVYVTDSQELQKINQYMYMYTVHVHVYILFF